MKGGTLFSGIGAPELAMKWVEWRWCAEIEPFASAVHKARFPGIPNLGDVTRIDPDAIEPVDIIVFGSPCQSFSVAGKRLGLDDPRGNLALVALQLVSRIRPRWFLFENVPGLLSSDEGRDFGAFLGAVEQCGYGWAYRTLDAQYFGVPQRRRRVFVVGCLGDWAVAAAVLFEPSSLRWHPAPSREAGQRIAGSLGASTGRNRGLGNENETDSLIPEIAAPLTHGVDSQGKGGYAGRRREDDTNLIVGTLGANGMSVRRLTPRECERLQGFPDDFTLIPYRGKPAADGPRYRALGNSMAVPVIRWIGRQLRAQPSETE